MDEKRMAALLSGEAKSLELARLADKMAAQYRLMAVAMSQERLGKPNPRYTREAEDIAARMERDAARGKPGTYKSEDGRAIACAWIDGHKAAAWTIAGEEIARRSAVFFIAERMAARLGA